MMTLYDMQTVPYSLSGLVSESKTSIDKGCMIKKEKQIQVSAVP